MGVDRPTQLEGGTFQHLGHGKLTQQFGDLGANHVAAQELAVAGVYHQLHHALGLPHGQSFSAGLDVEGAHLYLVALVPGLGFGQAKAGYLGITVGGPGHRLVVQRLGFQPRDVLHRRDALSRSHVGQGQLSCHVAYCVYPRHVGRHVVVHLNVAALGCDPQGLQSQVFAVGLNADGHQHLVDRQALLHTVLIDLDRHPTRARLHPGNRRPGKNVYAMPGEAPLQYRADVLVLQGNQPGQQFHHGDLDAVHPVEVSELDTDGPSTNDNHR